MSDLARLLQQYGYGDQPNALARDGESFDTSNVLARMPKRNPLADALRIAMNAIPENKELPAPAFPLDPRSLSMANMVRGGLDTAASWLDYQNKPQPSDYKASDVMGPLGAGFMGSMFAPKNALGIFGGRLAKTADHAALAKAEEMAAKGADRKDIWDQTGWFQGSDGKWRFEIDDSKSALNPYPNTPREAYEEVAHRAFVDAHPFDVERRRAIEPLKDLTTADVLAQWKERAAPILEAARRGDKEAAIQASDARQPWDLMLSEMGQRKYGPMSAYLEHPALYDAYPELKSLHTRVDPDLGEARGLYRKGDSTQGEQVVIRDRPVLSDHKSTLLHELQHKVQQDEGFANGANMGAFRTPPERMKQILMGIDADKLPQDSAFAKEIITAAILDVPGFKGGNLDDLRRHILHQQLLGVLPADLSGIGKKISDNVAWNMYRKAAGEVEARNAQARMKMSPDERRARPPWETEDVPAQQQRLPAR